jgi:hypothetical protein
MVLKKDHRIAQQLGILVNQREVGTSKIAYKDLIIRDKNKTSRKTEKV